MSNERDAGGARRRHFSATIGGEHAQGSRRPLDGAAPGRGDRIPHGSGHLPPLGLGSSKSPARIRRARREARDPLGVARARGHGSPTTINPRAWRTTPGARSPPTSAVPPTTRATPSDAAHVLAREPLRTVSAMPASVSAGRGSRDGGQDGALDRTSADRSRARRRWTRSPAAHVEVAGRRAARVTRSHESRPCSPRATNVVGAAAPTRAEVPADRACADDSVRIHISAPGSRDRPEAHVRLPVGKREERVAGAGSGSDQSARGRCLVDPPRRRPCARCAGGRRPARHAGRGARDSPVLVHARGTVSVFFQPPWTSVAARRVRALARHRTTRRRPQLDLHVAVGAERLRGETDLGVAREAARDPQRMVVASSSRACRRRFGKDAGGFQCAERRAVRRSTKIADGFGRRLAASASARARPASAPASSSSWYAGLDRRNAQVRVFALLLAEVRGGAVRVIVTRVGTVSSGSVASFRVSVRHIVGIAAGESAARSPLRTRDRQDSDSGGSTGCRRVAGRVQNFTSTASPAFNVSPLATRGQSRTRRSLPSPVGFLRVDVNLHALDREAAPSLDLVTEEIPPT